MPGMPPEWGPITIPDDASALDDEAATVRREMRRDVRRYRWRRRLRLGAPRTRDAPSLGVPLAIMAIAVVATLISLFAVAWPGGYNGGSPNPDSVTTRARPLTLPDLTLYDSDGVPVRIRDTAPAVVILVERCDCQRVVNEVAAAVDPRVSVLVVVTPDPHASTSAGPGGSTGPGFSPGVGSGGGPPTGPSAGRTAAQSGAPAAGPTLPTTGGARPSLGPDTAIGPATAPGTTGPSLGPSGSPSGSPGRSGPPGVRIRLLLDPAGALRASVPGLPSGGINGAILLVSLDWAVVRVVGANIAVADLKPDLERLAG